FLSFLVLYVYQALVVKPVPKPPAVTARNPAPQGSPAAAPTAAPKTPIPAAVSAPAATALVGDARERDVRVETHDVIAVFTNRGARLKSWRLKRFLDQKGEPLELVATELAGTQPLPFSLTANDPALTTTLNSALYTVSGEPAGGAATGSPADLRFEYRDSAGIAAVKEFHLEPTSYLVTVRARVTQDDRVLSPAIEWGPAVGDVASEVSRFTVKAEALMYANGNVQRLTQKDIAKQSTYQSDFSYAGVDDQYFMTAALSVRQAKVTYQAIAIPPPEGSKDQPRELVSYAIDSAQPETPIKFFAGPKDFDVLKSIDPELVRAINFGWFARLVVPLLVSLKWINGFVGNYGWSIIFLTIIINAIMFPLRHKSVVSMRKMQEIQPEVKAIQDRYAKLKTADPAKQNMNKELMALYRERGVNPASGCVPMLLTMPVLFACYSLLTTAIAL